MKPGAVFFVLFVIAYVGFEVWAVSKSSYRMERDFIYAQHVGAAHAVALCGVDTSDQLPRFNRNQAYALRKAREALAARAAAPASGDVASVLDALAARTRDEVDALIAENGCDDIEAWKLVRRFEMLAQQNPPISD